MKFWFISGYCVEGVFTTKILVRLRRKQRFGTGELAAKSAEGAKRNSELCRGGFQTRPLGFGFVSFVVNKIKVRGRLPTRQPEEAIFQ
jgi:hypothetical protein